MKKISKKHREELVEELKSLLPYEPSLSLHVNLYEFHKKHELRGGPRRDYRQFRIKYGIYECF